MDIDSYGIPPGIALRVELPAPDLRAFVANYHVYDSDAAQWNGVQSWALPTWPTIRFAISAPRLAVSLGPRRYDPIPDAALYGTSSYPRLTTSHGGISIGIAVTPLGWSRLFRVPADQCRDRVVPLASMWPASSIEATSDRLAGLGDEMTALPEILDRFVRAHLRGPTTREAEIVALTRLISGDGTIDIAAAAQAIGLASAALRRLSTRYFGFPPKLLLLRHRFLRVFTGMLLAGGELDYATIGGAYYDQSHFLRDARRFLGTTPRRFAAANDAFLLARMRAYAAVARASGQPTIYV